MRRTLTACALTIATCAATLAATAVPAAAQPSPQPVGPASLCERGGGQVIFIACAGGVYNGYVVVAGGLYRPQHGTAGWSNS